jgi:putative transcriptional regulator
MVILRTHVLRTHVLRTHVLRTPVGATMLVMLAILLGPAEQVARRPFTDTPAPSTAGRFLVASPELDDPNFRRTVIYMVEHDGDGAMGLVINRVLGSGPLASLLEGLELQAPADSEVEIRVHYGGPVERGRGFVLHSPDYQAETTVVLADFVAMTSSLDILGDIAAGKGPMRSLLALGYAGWAARQLEGELASGAWVIVDADAALLFDPDVEAKWQHALDRQGVDL